MSAALVSYESGDDRDSESGSSSTSRFGITRARNGRLGKEVRLGLDMSPNRPLARLVAGAMAGQRPASGYFRRGCYVPPVLDLPTSDVIADADEVERSVAGIASNAVEELCTRTLRGILLGEQLGDLADALDPYVVVWCPTFYATSRDDALQALHEDIAGGDTLTEVSIVVTKFDVVAPNAYLEWRLAGRFSNPCFVDSDVLLEPTGRLVETAGVMVVTLAEGRAVRLNCYYDDLALLEQLLTSP